MEFIPITKYLKIGRLYDKPEELDMIIQKTFPGTEYEATRSFYGDISETCVVYPEDSRAVYFEPVLMGNEWIVGYMKMSDAEWSALLRGGILE